MAEKCKSEIELLPHTCDHQGVHLKWHEKSGKRKKDLKEHEDYSTCKHSSASAINDDENWSWVKMKCGPLIFSFSHFRILEDSESTTLLQIGRWTWGFPSILNQPTTYLPSEIAVSVSTSWSQYCARFHKYLSKHTKSLPIMMFSSMNLLIIPSHEYAAILNISWSTCFCPLFTYSLQREIFYFHSMTEKSVFHFRKLQEKNYQQMLSSFLFIWNLKPKPIQIMRTIIIYLAAGNRTRINFNSDS